MKCENCKKENATHKCELCGELYCEKCADLFSFQCDCVSPKIISLNELLKQKYKKRNNK